MSDKKVSRLYRVLKWMLRTVYPKIEVVGTDKLPEEPCLIVANHCQMHGPIAAEFYTPGDHDIWCAHQMMKLKEVPAYAYQDFWSNKPKGIRWFFKLASYAIAPLSVLIFNNANTIAVYRDNRIISTFKNTVRSLTEGKHVVVFPEHLQKHNHIIYDFQDKFIDIARLYYKKTGKELCFLPMYIAPSIHEMHLGEPIRFTTQTPIDEERRRICDYLMEEITRVAEALPEHRVVPYENLSKKYHPSNHPKR